MVQTKWIYYLRKEELLSYLEEFKLETTGTVEELRKRLAQFAGECSEEYITRLETLAEKHAKSVPPPKGNTKPLTETNSENTGASTSRSAILTTTPAEIANSTGAINQIPTTTNTYISTNRHYETTTWNPNDASAIDKVRKWSVRFGGGKDCLSFMERLEELAVVYEVNTNNLPRIMSELLQDKALIWYRCNRKNWETWQAFKDEFLGFFLPPRYFERLDDSIRQRNQHTRENFKEYVIAISEMMHRTSYSDSQKLERIYRNSRQEYQLHIKRSEFRTLAELLLLAEDYEAIRLPSQHPDNTHSSKQPYEKNRQVRPETQGQIDVRQACRRCGKKWTFQQELPKYGNSVLLGLRKTRGTNHRMLSEIIGKRPRCPTSGVDGHRSQTTPVHIGKLQCDSRHIYVNLHFGEMVIPATIDTGATCSFINPDFATEIQVYTQNRERPSIVSMANGVECNVTDAKVVTLTKGPQLYELTLLVLPDATDNIVLGMDFLCITKATLNCVAQRIQMHTFTDNPTQERCAGVQEASIQEQIDTFLQEELPKFNEVSGLTPIGCHKITMRDETPVKQRYMPRNPKMLEIINKEIDDILAKGCIEPSKSPYSSPIVLVRKKNGKWRVCIDFRQINAKSIPDAYPLPRIQSILDRLRGARYISTLDLQNGYWQVPMDEESKQYTAFTVPGRGLFQWKVTPFGLHSAPATFQRILDTVIGPEMEPFAFAYLDDIIVIGRSLEEHKNNLRLVLQRLRDANLKINPEKCEFFKEELRYLGHVVSREGIHTDPEKIAAVRELKSPTNIRELRSCLGLASWYRRFVPDFADIVQPLTSLLKKGKHFRWEEPQEKAFQRIKQTLTEAPILACPDFEQPFILQTDASDYGLGAVLTQNLNDQERVVAYASRRLNKAEQNYSPTEKECLAIVWGIRKMRPYLEGYHFKVITDHLSLKWLNTIESPTGRIARWALELQQYSFGVEYRRGKLNVVADALSRQPRETVQQVQEQPSLIECTWWKKKINEVQQAPGKHPDYTIEGGRLYRHLKINEFNIESPKWKMCVPREQRTAVIRENHDALTAGHLGVRKTIDRVCNNYYWPGMMRDIQKFVKTCDSCQRYKPSQQRPAGEMLTKLAKAPWETVCADFVGPLPRSTHGNTMLLVFFDKFTKWVELVPMRTATGDTLTKAFRERILARFGVPKRLICDNGTQFTSRKFRNFLDSMGIHQQFTAPYTPQENPTERANRTIKTIISQTCRNHHRLWDEYVPEVTLAINSSKSETTGYTPAFLCQGRELRLPGQTYDREILGNGQAEVNPQQRAHEIQEIVKIVHRNLGKAAADQAKHYNLRRRKWRPQIGDLVLVKNHVLSKAIDHFAAKLAPKYDGPFQVWNFRSPVIVEVKNLSSSKIRSAHIGDLKPYHNNESEPSSDTTIVIATTP